MKTRTALMTAIVILAIQFAFAAEPAKKFGTEEQKVAFATKNLLSALQLNNPGVIESALQITAQMKMRHPEANVSELVTVMNSIWKKNPSGTIRYKAYLAMSICENPVWFSNLGAFRETNDENFFYTASNVLQEHLLSSNLN
jgi:hypothetical protein